LTDAVPREPANRGWQLDPLSPTVYTRQGDSDAEQKLPCLLRALDLRHTVGPPHRPSSLPVPLTRRFPFSFSFVLSLPGFRPASVGRQVPGMQIVHFPHPALRFKSTPIIRIDNELRQIVREMFDLMYAADGIGLAANQVGLPWRLFILNLTADPNERDDEHVFINPEIIERKGTIEAEEGCLSLPKLYHPVRRSQEVVEAYDLTGTGFEMTVDDLASRAVQHELDHLDGVLFIDRLSEFARREVASQVNDFETAFRQQQQTGVIPADTELEQQLLELVQRQS
jgi:peptide deformylase